MIKLLIWLLIIFLVLRMLRNSFKVVVFKQGGFPQPPFREEAAPQKPEGSVTIEQKSSGRTSSEDGEYVDYEEVK